MVKVRAILVIGETHYRDGLQVRNLGTKIEKAIEEALKGIEPENVVDIKINSQYMGVSGDQALIVILYKESKSEEMASAKLEAQKKQEEQKKHEVEPGKVEEEVSKPTWKSAVKNKK